MTITAQMRTDVAGLYTALFARAPERDGLGYWVSKLDTGSTVAQVAQSMYNVDAARSTYPLFLTNQEIVAKFYVNVLGRTADADGSAYWTAKLNAGTSKGQVISEMITAVSAYTGTDPAALTSQALFTNKVAAGLYYAVNDNGNDPTFATTLLTTVTSSPASVTAANLASDAAVAAASSQTFTLTTGVDTGAAFAGTSGNDVFNATNLTLTALDSINGGGGVNTLNVVDTAGGVDLSLATLKNIQNLNVTSIGGVAGNAVNVTGVTGLATATFALRAAAVETITASDTTAVNVTNTLGGATVVGGSTINVTTGSTAAALALAAATATANAAVQGAAGGTTPAAAAALFAATPGVSAADVAAVNAASTAGGATLVSVQTASAAALTAENAAVAAYAVTATNNAALASATVVGGSTVTVTDASATTLTTVSLSGNGGAATLTGSALTNVSIAKTSAATTIVNAAVGGHTETIGVNAVTGGAVITDATAKAVILNVTGASATTASSINLTTAAATTLTVNNAATLTLVSTDAVLKTLTITGAGTLTADVSGNAALTLVDASASTGANKITLSATEAFNGGSGVSTVTVSTAPTLAITGGAGTADVIIENANTDILTGNTKVTGFETLGLGLLTTGTYDATGFTHLSVANNTAANVTFANVAAGVDLILAGGTNNTVTYTLLNATGAADAMSLNLKGGVSATSSVSTTGIESVNIVTSDTNTTAGHAAVVDTLNLTATGVKSITATGTAGLNLVDTDTSITSVNASGVVGGFAFQTGALTAGAVGSANYTIVGSTAGGDNIDARLSAQGVTITETAGINTIRGSSTVASTLTGGSGADTIFGGAGKDIIVGGGGADTISGGAGADSITLSGNTSTIVQTALLASGANTSTTIQTSELTSTFDIVRGAVAGDKIALTVAIGVGGVGAVATVDLGLTNANLAGLDNKVVFASGTYDGAAGTFTFAANGLDTAVTYDTAASTATAFETIILVGFHAGATTAASSGTITLG